MKILFCTNAFENVTNGPAKFANHLLKINRLYPQHNIKILTEDIQEESADVYKLNLKFPKFLTLFSHIFRMQQYHKKALKIKNEFNWDIIVYNNAFIGLWSAIKLNTTVGMINDDNNATAKLGFSYLKVRYRLFRILEKASVRHHKIIITNSNYTKGVLSNVYPLINEKCKILYKGIELNKNERVPDFKEPLKILFVKKDYQRGGLLYLVRAISNIDLSIELSIVGPNEREIDLEYLNEIKKSKQNILIKGALPQKETFDLMRQSDIFCVPSLKEALGVANIEGLSFGCSVITTNVGGIPEVMDTGNNGWLVNPESSVEIADAILDCYNDSQKRIIKRNNGQNFIKKFNIKHTIKNFVGIIEECHN